MYEWANEMNCAVTVCDTKGIILYMNEKACRTFAKHGDLIGLHHCEERGQENDLSDGMETGRSSRWPGGDFDGNTRRDATLYEKITK